MDLDLEGPWKEKLLRCYKQFVQDAYPDTIIDDCYTEGILTSDEKDKLLTYGTPSEKNRHFLKILLHKSEDTYKRFLECLTDSHVKELILETDVTKPLSHEDEENAMQLRRKIYCNMQYIVDGPDLRNVIDDFVSERIFEIDDVEKITNANLTTKEQNTTFLNILLKKMPRGCNLLISKLSQTHPDLVETIKSTAVAEATDKDIEAHLRIVESQKKGVKLTQEEIERIKMDLHPEEISPRTLEDWRKSENTFYPTKATTQISEKIKSMKKVIGCGLPGAGKTAAIRHIALELKNEGHRLCCVHTCNEIKCKMDKFSKEEKQLYVIDDVFGVHGIDDLKRKQWCDDNKDDLEWCFDNTNISILCSSRIQVLQDPQLKHIKTRFTIINISEGACELSSDERTEIFRNHAITKQRKDLLTENKDQLKIEIKEKIREVECAVGCFPLVSHLYTGDKETKQTIEEYFNKPLTVIADHLEKLEIEDRLSHFCLLLCLIYENKLPVKTLKVGKEEEETKNKREELLEISELPVSTLRPTIKNKMDTLLQTFLKREGDTYQFMHDIVYDAVIQHICSSPDVLEVIVRHCNILLCVACGRRCDTDVIQALIDAGANVNAQDVDGRYSLAWSVVNDDYKTTHLLLDHGADVNLCDKTGCSVLHRSVDKGHYEITQLLLQHNADVSLCDEDGFSALHGSVYAGDYKTTQLLLDHKANVNQCGKHGLSALHLSVENGDYKTIQLLLDHKADVNQCMSGRSALHKSVAKGDYKTTQLLLENKANVNQCTKDDLTALHLSVAEGDYKTTKLLLDHKADVNQCNKDSISALYMSVVKGDYKTTQLLLDHKADVNLCKDGRAALYLSVVEGDYKTTQLLLDHKANVNQCTPDGRSALYMAVFNGDNKTTRLLLENKADANMCDEDGRSALFMSVLNGDYETTQSLLEHEANVNLCDNEGVSILHLSVACGDFETTQILLIHKADVNVCDKKGRSLLYLSVVKGDYETTQLLLDHKVDVNLCDKGGWSALHRAVIKGDYKTTQLLLDHKADVNLCTEDGSSLLFISQFMGHEKITSLLLAYDAVCWYNGIKYKTITDIPDDVVDARDRAMVREEVVSIKKRIQDLKKENQKSD